LRFDYSFSHFPPKKKAAYGLWCSSGNKFPQSIDGHLKAICVGYYLHALNLLPVLVRWQAQIIEQLAPIAEA
jgi:hypothetical protein